MTPEMKHVGKLAKKSGKAFGMDKVAGTDKRDLFVELESLSLAEKEIDDGEDGTIFVLLMKTFFFTRKVRKVFQNPNLSQRDSYSCFQLKSMIVTLSLNQKAFRLSQRLFLTKK